MLVWFPVDGNDSSKTNILDDLDAEEAKEGEGGEGAAPSAPANPPPYTGAQPPFQPGKNNSNCLHCFPLSLPYPHSILLDQEVIECTIE